ncbi:MAG TPA: alpha/beta fold hydrolase [Sedimenticola thiotaurini]|uniref:Alpha/beta fold hydrolase n=1 Tax=Sedimenticola thiotaurini TaxID=1543721 RepID=A0A831WA95_9GAMM|nr:alpha/beta fold hydrolase [Sedimenticola thiotaurini]
MELHYREYGSYRAQRPTLVLLHGLLGSSVNWHGIARRLERHWHLLVPDLRNHGRSPHAEPMDYPEMAADLLAFLDRQGLDDAVWVGHSMGGKAAMWLALRWPERAAGLVVVDIAPVPYRHGFDTILTAMEAVDLAAIGSRRQAEGVLARYLDDPGLRQYLLQNLALENGRWRWRVDLQALRRGMGAITGFEPPADSSGYPGPALFLYGSESDYVTAAQRPRILELFPLARLRMIAGAGHWLYAEQPEAFVAALESFLRSAVGGRPRSPADDG